jgi:hypothetical protein
MTRPSPDAAEILDLPHRNHPRLRAGVEALAACDEASLASAVRILDAAARDAGITALDIEMHQPGANTSVPFVPAISATANPHDEAVRRHLNALIGAPR